MDKNIVYEKICYFTSCDSYNKISYKELINTVKECEEEDKEACEKEEDMYQEYFIGFDGPSEFSDTIHCVLLGSRLETDEEYDKRLEKEKKEKKARLEWARKQYEDLKKQFENES